MNDYGLRPKPPTWALEADLPEPQEDETFIPYVSRLGLDVEDLLVDLTEQTICLANGRFRCLLQKSMPAVFDRYIEAYVSARLPRAERDRIERNAELLFGQNFRARSRSLDEELFRNVAIRDKR